MSKTSIPNLRDLVEKAETLPNSVLEEVFKQNASGGIRRFGRRYPVPVAILDYLRIVIEERNREGNYIFSNRTEKKRLRAIALFLPEEEGWLPTTISKTTETWRKKIAKKKRRRNCFVLKADGTYKQYN
jgi:hypothetical protein